MGGVKVTTISERQIDESRSNSVPGSFIHFHTGVQVKGVDLSLPSAPAMRKIPGQS